MLNTNLEENIQETFIQYLALLYLVKRKGISNILF